MTVIKGLKPDDIKKASVVHGCCGLIAEGCFSCSSHSLLCIQFTS